MAKVDIVVPCYNYGRFLENCVISVLDQSISDLRVLIIDDASTDDSLAIARRLAGRDSRVSVIGHPVNMGHIDTYNEGIEWASSNYFLLLSADDLLVPGALQRAIEIMDSNPGVVLTFGDCVAWFDAERAPDIHQHAGYAWEQFDLLTAICGSATNLVPTPTAIVRTSVQQAIGGYRKSLPHAGDMEMWLRFAANGAVARINAVQAIYRIHANSMSHTFFAEIMVDCRQRELAFTNFFDEYAGRLDSSLDLKSAASRALADGVFRKGVGLIRRGRFEDGVRLMRRAMEMDPGLRRSPPLWRLFQMPGSAGRSWARSAVGGAARRLLNRRSSRDQDGSQRPGTSFFP